MKKEETTITVRGTAYHRNGISGAGFQVVVFDDPDYGRMLGIVFAEEGHVAVLKLGEAYATSAKDAPTKIPAELDLNTRWRGDHYEPYLRAALDELETPEGPTAWLVKSLWRDDRDYIVNECKDRGDIFGLVNRYAAMWFPVALGEEVENAARLLWSKREQVVTSEKGEDDA